MNGNPADRLRYVDDAGQADVVVVGANGINPNAVPAEVTPDADITHTGVFDLGVITQGETGFIDARGGAGTGGPLDQPIVLLAGGADSEPDVLFGGLRSDSLQLGVGGGKAVGGKGSDSLEGPDSGSAAARLIGGSGGDVILGGLGPDSLLGEEGRDKLIADDGFEDTKIDCGKGKDKNAKLDLGLDPAPISC